MICKCIRLIFVNVCGDGLICTKCHGPSSNSHWYFILDHIAVWILQYILGPFQSWLTLRCTISLCRSKLCLLLDLLWPPRPSHCRMVILETHQTEDPSGMSNLYVLEVAENYVMLAWVFCVLAEGIMGNSLSCVHASTWDFLLSSLPLTDVDAAVFSNARGKLRWGLQSKEVRSSCAHFNLCNPEPLTESKRLKKPWSEQRRKVLL